MICTGALLDLELPLCLDGDSVEGQYAGMKVGMWIASRRLSETRVSASLYHAINRFGSYFTPVDIQRLH